MTMATTNSKFLADLHEQALADCPAADDRRESWRSFTVAGLPGKSDEAFRYTGLSHLAETEFSQGDPAADVDIAPFDFNPNGPLLVFVNGWYRADLSRAPKNASPLRESDDANIHGVAGRDQSPMTLLNHATFTDGASITAGDTLVHILHIAAGDRPVVVSSRCVVHAEVGATVKVAESHVALGSADHLLLPSTEITAEAKSSVSLSRAVRGESSATILGSLHVQQAEDSHVLTHTITFGGGVVRNEVHAYLDGERCDSNFDGMYLLTGEQHVDNHLRVEHNAAHCDSREFYKGVLADNAKSVFTGRIYVKEGAQKTDAKQTNRNILLSDDAEAVARPQLEIYADDVKCTHGATIGVIDPDAMFYLQARGIPKDAAHTLLIFAFLNESLSELEDSDLRASLEHELLDRLPHGEFVRSL